MVTGNPSSTVVVVAATVVEVVAWVVDVDVDASVEGETTALYVQRLLQDKEMTLTRLATGIPVGGALAYTDEVTLQRAFQHRQEF